MLHEARGGPARAAIVYVHPWAEELNKTRRMAALQARALADAGCTVLQIDLLGCGDSSGEFREASWQAWVDDVTLACRWLSKRVQAPLWLWGLRAGCLLAVQASHALGDSPRFLFCQPVLQGRVALQQFLRLKTASDMLSGESGGGTDAVLQRLSAGESVDVAGYELTAPLTSGLASAALAPPASDGRVVWLELSSQDDPRLAAASGAVIERWRSAGYDVDARAVKGPSFWQTVEIEEAPTLIEASVSAITEMAAA